MEAGTALSQDESLCVDAHHLLTEQMLLPALIDPDTMDDSRTRQILPGCRVTAAGVTSIGLQAESERFFLTIMEAGWPRTPDAMDAPAESSFRFRMNDADCFFFFYGGPRLGTPSELEVSRKAVPAPGEERYNVIARCVPALPAAP
jgi:hypothetical protein